MPISLTCSCGAKLEIDDAFAGKTIPCPDCQKPLSTAPPLPQPDQPVSMLAVASLIVALVLLLVPLGGLVAAGLAYFALRRIDASAGALAGRGLAKAGMVVGVSGFLVTIALIFFGPALRMDGFVRAIEYTGSLDYSKAELEKSIDSVRLTIRRPSDGWGRVKLENVNALRSDHMVLYSPFEDGFLTVVSENIGQAAGRDDAERRRAALRLLERSDMVHVLMGAGRAAAAKERDLSFAEIPEDEFRDIDGWGQYTFHTSALQGKPLTFLVRYKMLTEDTLFVLAAAVRSRNFDHAQPQIKEAMDSFRRN
ncbi:MAG: hypothetical protein U0793_20925 [Gemmataceae bacterium]